MLASALKGTDLDREEMLRRAWALAPKLKERAGKTEKRGRILPETIQDFHKTKLWRIHQPNRYGGLELDFALYIDIGEALASGCASTAWVWANLACHDWMLGMFSAEAQDEIWTDNKDTLIGSALVYPCGKITPVDEGYILSGRWPFSSGIEDSDWIMLGGMVNPKNEKPPTPLMLVVPSKSLEIIKTWEVAGLVGTGSHDVSCKELFVPRHLTLNPRNARGGPTPGSKENLNSIYRLPLLGLFPHIIAGVILGMARGAFDDYLENVKDRTATYNKSKIGEHTTVQIRIAEAGAQIDAARLLLHSNCKEATTIAETNASFDENQKARWRRDAAYAARLCGRAVDVIYEAAGGGANYRRNPLQRHFRDIHAAISHIGVAWDVNAAEYGRSAIGLPIGNPNV